MGRKPDANRIEAIGYYVDISYRQVIRLSPGGTMKPGFVFRRAKPDRRRTPADQG
jgi:hypothetical protein